VQFRRVAPRLSGFGSSRLEQAILGALFLVVNDGTTGA
jgi:hypothetical protein